MAGKFEVYKDRSGKFRFRLKASNGQVVATLLLVPSAKMYAGSVADLVSRPP
jgi:Domain of unknown function (DUF1508)